MKSCLDLAPCKEACWCDSWSPSPSRPELPCPLVVVGCSTKVRPCTHNTNHIDCALLFSFASSQSSQWQHSIRCGCNLVLVPSIYFHLAQCSVSINSVLAHVKISSFFMSFNFIIYHFWWGENHFARLGQRPLTPFWIEAGLFLITVVIFRLPCHFTFSFSGFLCPIVVNATLKSSPPSLDSNDFLVWNALNLENDLFPLAILSIARPNSTNDKFFMIA